MSGAPATGSICNHKRQDTHKEKVQMALSTASEVSVASDQISSYSRSTIVLIGICFVFSGAAGLIYEVLWARMLGLLFGATTLAVSTVLAAFMGGLALGSALAGKFAQRIRKPLSVYGLMEILIALYALLVPLLFRWIDDVYALIWQQLQPGYFSFSLWRFALSGVVLLAPTTLMGATLPVLAAALVRSSGKDSNSVTRLYACNLVGAILGTLAAGFVLLPWLGVRTTIAVAAGLNIIVGVIAILLQGRAQSQTNVAEEIEAEESVAVVEGQGFWFCAAL